MRRDELRELAKTFRKNPTPSEQKVWEILRAKRCLGLKFKRQFPLRGFIVDFFCRQLALILEIDGGAHLDRDQAERDAARDELLRACGFKILRIGNEDVTSTNLERLLRSQLRVPPPLV